MAAYSNLQLNESILLVSGNQLLTDELLEFKISWVCYLPNEIEKSILDAIRPFFGGGGVFFPSFT